MKNQVKYWHCQRKQSINNDPKEKGDLWTLWWRIENNPFKAQQNMRIQTTKQN